LILVYALLAVGLLFNFLGVVGLLRFPDAYTRLHASTKCTTFGSIFICLSVIAFYLFYLETNDPLVGPQSTILVVHIVVAILVLMIANATESHAIARAAHKSGLKPVGVVDALEAKK
jgi:multicomponent Na+:H+ antiporter subunit G